MVSCIDNFLLRFLGSGDNPALRLVGPLGNFIHRVDDLHRTVDELIEDVTGWEELDA